MKSSFLCLLGLVAATFAQPVSDLEIGKRAICGAEWNIKRMTVAEFQEREVACGPKWKRAICGAEWNIKRSTPEEIEKREIACGPK
ncbi:hypothetical protein NA57DRAFT_70252 [Rhizodiscina lignyota]|uniref:Uncharacterized protein n=1 Tax=Rhizodiscina lignyota TaxID=1504668 RepID=A0A9P4ITK5_9PEZI|nr:hypothetical protein NA57DRAFT_70252 [Rhizodiscina lignyota]